MLILDEADVLVARGFADEVSDIVGQMRPDRQTMLFSATFSAPLEAAAATWLRAPVRIYVDPPARTDGDAGTPRADATTAARAEPRAESGAAAGAEPAADFGSDLGLSAVAAHVEQRIMLCDGGSRRPALLNALVSLGVPAKGAPRGGSAASRGQGPRMLVFAEQVRSLRALLKFLRAAGVRCAALHGELAQSEREAALADFKAGKCPVLLSTDVAARGLHIRKLSAIVNFDLPPKLEQYVHRAGRTGRNGESGVAVSLVTRARPAESARFIRGVAALARRADAAAALPPTLVATAIDLGVDLDVTVDGGHRPQLAKRTMAAPAAGRTGAAASSSSASSSLLDFARAHSLP